MTASTGPSPSPAQPGAAGRVWTLIRILNVRLRFILLMVVVGLIAGHWDDIMNRYDRWQRPVQVSKTAAGEQVEYYCPMHPNIVRAEPGNCPICGMPLAKREKTGRQELPEGVLSRLQLTPERILLGRIGTTPVGYQLLGREIRTVGLAAYDETSRAIIAARIKGRIDQLMVNYVGQRVEKGDPLASLYSPDLLIAQRELIEASQSVKQPPTPGGVPTGGQTLVAGAKRKLSLWGITDQQIDEIIARGTPETHLNIYSPISGIVTEKSVLEGRYVNEGDTLYTIADLSRVWLQVQIFDDQIEGVQIGTAVEVTSAAYAGEIFAGRIAFIAYNVDLTTRTVAARIEVANPQYKLRPGMYVAATIRLPAGRVEEIATAASAPASTATATADGEKHIDDLARAYLTLWTALAADKTDPPAAAALAQHARALAEQAEAELRTQATAVATLAGQLDDQVLAEQRTIFKSLSARVIELLRAHPPAGPALFVAHCPMAKADWLQTSEQITNPYYGSAMLACGNITGQLKAAAKESDEQYARGYFCPIYPDHLFDEPAHCPIDGFPLKYVKVQKVLAVPQSAVINTGTRKVVYRQSAPGTFDMVEVKLGPRAGEFYPVLAGLNPGDEVATAGTFLVDAENRLNPAAVSQYFGASGGPQSGGHQH